MNFEGPKATTIYEKETEQLNAFLKGKSKEVLEKIAKEPYKISGIIRDDFDKDPESRMLNCVKMYSDREIAEAAQTELEKRSAAGFFAL